MLASKIALRIASPNTDNGARAQLLVLDVNCWPDPAVRHLLDIHDFGVELPDKLEDDIFLMTEDVAATDYALGPG